MRPLDEILLEYSAIQLSVQSVRRTHGNVELSDEDMRAVAQICRLAQDIPLAILLAAAWVELLSPADIAQDVAFLAAESDDPDADNEDEVPTRQRSMHAIFDHSWNLLTKTSSKSLHVW